MYQAVSGSGTYAFPPQPQSNPDLPKTHMGWVVDGYVGEWKDSHHNPHGTGKMLFANGSTYDGQFTNGKFDGNGVMSYEVDGVTELPDLDYMWSAGDKYDGGHRADVRHGACTCRPPPLTTTPLLCIQRLSCAGTPSSLAKCSPARGQKESAASSLNVKKLL
jgi:hypothetical protein